MANQTLEQFYQDFETLPKLISLLALSVADAQNRMDQGYLTALGELAKIAGELKGSHIDLGDFEALFKAMGPTRYQFTETIVDVRADLRMSSGSELSVGGSLGLKTPMFAVAVNASYTQRTAADFQASALIHCVINAVTSDPNLMKVLLDAAPPLPPGTITPADAGKGLLDGWKGLIGFRIVTGSLPAAKSGTAYPKTTIQAAGGTGTLHFTSDPQNPGGLTLSDTGDLTGTVTATQSFTFTVTAKDSSDTPKTAVKTFTVQVTA